MPMLEAGFLDMEVSGSELEEEVETIEDGQPMDTAGVGMQLEDDLRAVSVEPGLRTGISEGIVVGEDMDMLSGSEYEPDDE